MSTAIIKTACDGDTWRISAREVFSIEDMIYFYELAQEETTAANSR